MKWNNRLTVIGSQTQVKRFQESDWDIVLGARYSDLMENSPGHFACQFKTQRYLPEPIRNLSRRWPRLTFLLDSESETKRIKGLAKAKSGELEHCEISY